MNITAASPSADQRPPPKHLDSDPSIYKWAGELLPVGKEEKQPLVVNFFTRCPLWRFQRSAKDPSAGSCKGKVPLPKGYTVCTAEMLHSRCTAGKAGSFLLAGWAEQKRWQKPCDKRAGGKELRHPPARHSPWGGRRISTEARLLLIEKQPPPKKPFFISAKGVPVPRAGED